MYVFYASFSCGKSWILFDKYVDIKTFNKFSLLTVWGLLFPLNLLGNKIYKIVDKNPFAIVGFNFTRAMQGKLTIEELIFYIILSFSWFILFFVLYKITYYFGLKRYEGMGA